jgi:hypothetical protein
MSRSDLQRCCDPTLVACEWLRRLCRLRGDDGHNGENMAACLGRAHRACVFWSSAVAVHAFEWFCVGGVADCRMDCERGVVVRRQRPR